MEKFRQTLLQDALKFYQEFVQQKSNDPTVRYEMAQDYLRLARLQGNLLNVVDKGRVERDARQAIDTMEKLAAEFPAEPKCRELLGDLYCASYWTTFWDDKGQEKAIEGQNENAGHL
jgi:hypothetical protein